MPEAYNPYKYGKRTHNFGRFILGMFLIVALSGPTLNKKMVKRYIYSTKIITIYNTEIVTIIYNVIYSCLQSLQK